MSAHPYDILVRPLVTEKAMSGSEKAKKQYAFRVAMDSNKVQIRRAIEAAFGVKVVKVNTVRIQGKLKRLRTRKEGRRPDWKKAVVTLAEGQTINLI